MTTPCSGPDKVQVSHGHTPFRKGVRPRETNTVQGSNLLRMRTFTHVERVMEKTLTKIKFEDLDSREETSASDLEGYGSEDEEERQTRQLVVQQNRKGKKSGGFQSMGKFFSLQ